MATAVKIDMATYRYVEHILTHYPEAKRDLFRIKEEVIYTKRKNDENIGGGRSNLPGDPVGESVAILYSLERVIELEKNIRIIEEIYNQLQPMKQKMIDLFYWSRPRRFTSSGVALELERDERTIRRWRREVITLIALKKGLA